MTVTNKMSSRSDGHVGRRHLICYTMLILLLQIFTSEAFRLWSPQAYRSKQARASPTSQPPKSLGRPDLAPYTSSQTQAHVKSDTNKKVLMKQKLIDEQHLLHLGMNGPTSSGSLPQASYMNSETQVHVKRDTNNKVSMQQKLMNEQHLLHLGMHGHPTGSVQQISPPKKQVNPFLDHTAFMPIVPNAAHVILLPTRLPSPATSTSNSPTCNSDPQTPTQKPAKNPGQNPTQKPAQNPGQNPTQKPAQKPGQNPTQKPAQNPGQNPAQNPEELPFSPNASSAHSLSSGGGSSKPETVTGPSDSGNRSAICYSRPQPGTCLGAFKRYYYNVTLDQCDCFLYGGCEGRASPVAGDTYLGSFEQCLKTCFPGKKTPGPRCATVLRPPVFFIDPSDQEKKRERTASPGVENREEKLVEPTVSA